MHLQEMRKEGWIRMKKILEWIDSEILDDALTPIVGAVVMLAVEWLGKNRIPDAAIYALNVVLGLLCLVSAVKSWSGGIRIAAVVFFAIVMLGSSVEIIKDLANGPASTPTGSGQRYVQTEPARQSSGGQTSGGRAIDLSGWSGSSTKQCTICEGRKTCNVCGGLKKYQYVYALTHPCINGKIRVGDQTFTCSSCNGSGKCYSCGGNGKCSVCNGSGTR